MLVHKILSTARPHSSIDNFFDITRHAFSHAASTIWNNLLTDIRFADLFMNFVHCFAR